MNKPTELYACLYAREFPAQALLRLRPELRGKPYAVLDGEPPLQQVCSLNTKARLLGMRHGMTRTEVETFPAVTILPRSRNEEAAARAILLECAGAFSPRVEDRSENTDRSEDTAFLCGIDIAGTRTLFGPPEMLARSLLQRVRAIGIAARITVSSNFHVAACLAKGLSPRVLIRVVAWGEEATALAHLPVTVLDLTDDQAETFAAWGIHTLEMLAALPEKELIARMGQDSKRLRQLARGERPHLFQPAEPPFVLEERMELDTPVEILDSLLFAIGMMLDQLILRAKAHIVALASVTVALALDGGSAHVRTVRPALPSNDKQLWIKLLHLDLKAHPPRAAILAVTLKAEPGSTNKVQLGIFSPQLPEPSRLDVTLAHINAIVGEGNAGRAVLNDTYRCEGFRIEPFSISAGQSLEAAPAALRPAMRQLRPAEAIRVTLQNERPKAFVFRNRRYIVKQAYGPWLASGEWWTSARWGCEQWDLTAHAQDGAMLCCCLVRNVLQNAWRMSALYD